MTTEFFKRCSTCRKPIAYGAQYYKCSVSTCNRKVTALYFCSVPCWDAHVPDARHRDAWAEVEKAPSGPNALEDQAAASGSTDALRPDTEKINARRVVSQRQPVAASSSEPKEDLPADLPRDVLVVMSKVKTYVKARAGLRTSDGVSDPLSDHLRCVCARAIRSAKANERGTVLARDIEAALRDEIASE